MRTTVIVGNLLFALIVSGSAVASGQMAAKGGCSGQGMAPAQGDCQQAGGKGHGMQGGKGHGKQKGYAMRHANPMPNLMKIVNKQGDQLGLSDDQAKQLAAWRESNMKPMHARAERVMALEAELKQAALDGKPKAELMGMASRIMTERTQIIATKADCRDNLKRVLSPEQFAKLVSLQPR